MDRLVKICNDCKLSKELDQFNKDKTRKDGFTYRCKECLSKCSSKSYQNNKEKHLKRVKERYDNTSYHKDRMTNNKEYYHNYHNNRWINNINYKIAKNFRNRLNQVLKNKKQKLSLTYLGCTIEQFKQHLENQFKPEMNWSNHGTVWEIDHIKSCESFDLTDSKQQEECFHYLNNKPLFKTTKIAESFGYTDEIGNRNKSNK